MKDILGYWVLKDVIVYGSDWNIEELQERRSLGWSGMRVGIRVRLNVCRRLSSADGSLKRLK